MARGKRSKALGTKQSTCTIPTPATLVLQRIYEGLNVFDALDVWH